MKRLLACVVVAALAFLGTLRAADEPRAKPAPQRGWLLGPSGMPNAAADLENLEKTVTLTDAQKKAIGEILEARDKAMTEFRTANKEKFEAAPKRMWDAFQSQDREAIAKVQKEMQALNAPAQEITKKTQAEVDKVLTAEQRDKFQEAQALNVIKMMTAPVELSPEQIKQLTADFKAAQPEERWRKMSEAIQKVLTPEQKTAVVKERLTNFVRFLSGRLNLTAEQTKKVDALVDEVAKAGGPNPGEAISRLQEKIEPLLTDEQKETLKKGAGLWGGPRLTVRPGPAPGTPPAK